MAGSIEEGLERAQKAIDSGAALAKLQEPGGLFAKARPGSSMSLLDAPIWSDAGTWVVLGVCLLFIVVGIGMHRVIMKVLRVPADAATNKENHV